MKIPASKVPAQVWADKARRRVSIYQSCPCDRSSFHIVIYHTIILRYSQILNPAPWSEPRIETVGRQGERRRG